MKEKRIPNINKIYPDYLGRQFGKVFNQTKKKDIGWFHQLKKKDFSRLKNSGAYSLKN